MCSPQGGMRKSIRTNTLVLISDYTKGLYQDKWIGDEFHYTGMGQRGDMNINAAQNKTLAESKSNGIDIHLFIVINPSEYIYIGRVELVREPYIEIQPDSEGNNREVWMFPIKPIERDYPKIPKHFIFDNEEDCKKNIQKQNSSWITNNSSNHKSTLKGKMIKHKTYGKGTITTSCSGSGIPQITVQFEEEKQPRTLNYDHCINNKLVEFIE